MTEKFTADDEQVDDILLLMAHMERMGIPALLNEHFREGLSQFGYSKDHRPELPQVQVVLAAMAPGHTLGSGCGGGELCR